VEKRQHIHTRYDIKKTLEDIEPLMACLDPTDAEVVDVLIDMLHYRLVPTRD
jgi:hypothetical protein